MPPKLINPAPKSFLIALDAAGGSMDPTRLPNRIPGIYDIYGHKNEAQLWNWLAMGGWIDAQPFPENRNRSGYPDQVWLTSKGKAAVRDIRQEIEATKKRKIAYDKMTKLVESLKRKYPEARLSFGYIGNFERSRDDRAFYVFSKLSQPGSPGRNWKWGGYAAENDGILKMWDWAKPNLEKAVQKALAKNEGGPQSRRAHETPSPTRVAHRHLQGHHLDRYPSISVPRGWKPPKDQACPDQVRKDSIKALYREVNGILRKHLVPELKRRLWSVNDFSVDSGGEYDPEDGVLASFEVSAKAGQKIGLGGNAYLVLDRDVNYECLFSFLGEEVEGEFEDSEQFDVDEFAEWSYTALCPPTDLDTIRHEDGHEYRLDSTGIAKFFAHFDNLWRKRNQIRSKIQKRAAELTGLPRRKVVQMVNNVIERAPLKGIHRDQYWRPIHALWKALEKAGIDFHITKSDYEHEVYDGQRVPVRKVWRLEVPFTNERGRDAIVYIQVIAAGAGSVAEPLEAYDVIAYAS